MVILFGKGNSASLPGSLQPLHSPSGGLSPYHRESVKVSLTLSLSLPFLSLCMYLSIHLSLASQILEFLQPPNTQDHWESLFFKTTGFRAVLLLAICLALHLKEMKLLGQRDIFFTPIFISALHPLAKTWSQPIISSMDEWIKKM